MTEEEKLIDDNNELIVIFDGWELTERNKTTCFVKNGYRLYHYELRYHNRWDLLMPIWVKFRNLKFEVIQEQFEHSEFRQNIAHLICYSTIESAHQAVVSGIQWYNSIK